jgi:ABC-type multidrug transport system ATPase subunit
MSHQSAPTQARNRSAGLVNSPALLRVHNLTRRGNGPFNFDISAGECIAITGESGSGKSVLLRMVADLDQSEGDVLLDEVSRNSWPAPAWRKMVTYQAAEPAWWERTLREHLTPQHTPQAEHLLSRLRLAPALLDSDLVRLSTGERQRLALIRSLVARPRVLMLDEPASALDMAAVAAMEDVLQEHLQEGMSMLLVTHSMEQAARLGHRQMRMDSGRLVPA